MAKSGLDYFPLACHFDDNIELIEAEFGLQGLAIIVKLYQKIYGELGYYCEWNDEVALLFSRKACGLSEGGNVVSEVVKAAVKRGIFDEEIFSKYGILTSAGIQKRYFEAAKRRNEIEVEKSYLLLSADNIPNNVNIISKNVCRNEKNVYRNQQRKVKESRVEESKGNKRKENIPPLSPLEGEKKEQSASPKRNRFIPPTIEEVADYCFERNNGIDAQVFTDFYTSKDWMIGRNKMKDWKAAVRTWERSRQQGGSQKQSGDVNANKQTQLDYLLSRIREEDDT